MMSIEDLLNELNSLDEHNKIEAKTASNQIGDAILESISSFSNEPGMGGGYILLGVAPSQDGIGYSIVGVNDTDKLQQDLLSKCSSKFSSIIRPIISVQEIENKKVIGIYIEEANPLSKPISFEIKVGAKNHQRIKKVAYRRIGSADVLCTNEDYAEFIQLQQNRPYDETILSGVSIDDINPDAVLAYRRLRKKNNPVASELSQPDSDLLISLHCAERKNGVVIPTIAGLILFGTDSVLKRYFSMMRFDYIRTKSSKWSNIADQESYYTIELREALMTLLPKAEATIMANIEREISTTSDKLTRNERPIVPNEAIREALVNSLMHRDYRQNGPTMVVQYPNRIEFFNHGYSLKPIEDLELFGGSKTRNQTIANVLHETEYAENKGSGISKIRRLMKTANLEEPIFQSSRDRNTFLVTFYFHQLIDEEAALWLSRFNFLKLSGEDARILVFAHKNGSISNEQGRDITGLDTILVSRKLTELRKKGALEQHSGGPNTYYTISSRFVTSEDTKINELNTKMSDLDTKTGYLDTKMINASPRRLELLKTLPDELQSEILSLGIRLSPEKTEEMIIKICKIHSVSAAEIAIIFDKGRFWSKDPLKHLLDENKIKLTIPEKPNSKKQAYYIPIDDAQKKILDEWSSD